MKRNFAKEQRRKDWEALHSGGCLNYFASFEDGSSVLFYVSVTNIGELSIRRFAEKVTGTPVTECYHVPQEELQYYCIDERVWIDTEEKAKKLLSIIG